MSERLRRAYELQFTASAIRDLEKLDLQVRRKAFSDIEQLSADPRPRGSRKLQGAGGLYRIRVGPHKAYRAIYEIRDQVLVVLVVKVGHRKDVYRQFPES